MLLIRSFSANLLLVSMLLIPLKAEGANPGTERLVLLHEVCEHWRWKHFWFGETELGSDYASGRLLPVLLFWSSDTSVRTIGFCSSDLGLCQEYRDPPESMSGSRMKFSPATEATKQLEQFVEAGWSILHSLGEYKTEKQVLTLPALSPPQAVRDRIRPDGVEREIVQILQEAACGRSKKGCGTHVFIPFFSRRDPELLLYRECSRACGENAKPLVLILVPAPQGWHLGATAFIADPIRARNTRLKIEANLMVDASFSASGKVQMNFGQGKSSPMTIHNRSGSWSRWPSRDPNPNHVTYSCDVLGHLVQAQMPRTVAASATSPPRVRAKEQIRNWRLEHRPAAAATWGWGDRASMQHLPSEMDAGLRQHGRGRALCRMADIANVRRALRAIKESRLG